MTINIRHRQRPGSFGERTNIRTHLLSGGGLTRCDSLLVLTALVGVLVGSVVLQARADGGAGGDAGGNPGGVGGTGYIGNAGADSGTIAGGGGGGAGGGAGGSSLGGGSGGGGGGNGANTTTITNTSPLAGGNGGNGGNGPSVGTGGGGGGGAGGYGAIVTGTGANSNTSTIAGGAGGAGGASGGTAGDHGGNGGDGGVGIEFTSSGVTFTNSGTVTGGDGGVGGAAVGSGTAGSPGAGGAGIVGAGLTVINSGNISGGLSGNGSTRANAITFTGGTNILELQAGYGVTGNVVDATNTGTLRLGGTTNSFFSAAGIGPAAQYQGFSTFVKTGTSTWTLTGVTTALTPWTINQGTLAIFNDNSLGATAGGLTIDGGTLEFLGAVTSSRSITLNPSGGTFYTVGVNATLGGPISGLGGLTKTGAGTLTLSGANSYMGATIVDLGTLQAGATNVFASTSPFTIHAGGVLDLNSFDQTLASVSGAGSITLGSATLSTGGDNTNTNYSGGISGTGGLTKIGTGAFTLSGSTTYSGATNVNVGTLQAGAVNAFSPSSAFTIAPGATLDLNNFNQSIGSLAGSGFVTLGSAILATGNDNTNTAFSGGISGSGGLTKFGSGTFTLSGLSSYTGATAINAGTLQAGGANVFAPGSAFSVASGATLDLNSFAQSIGSLAGASGGAVSLGSATLTAGSDNTTTTFAGAISGTGGLTKVGTGVMSLDGINGYSGLTTVAAGVLSVNGWNASSSVLVNSGATLGGVGTVGPTTIASGGTLAPGNSIGTLNVNGTLALNSGSTYMVEVSPSSSDKTVVTGTASLAGTAQAVFQAGSYIPKNYTILSSSGLGGTQFDTFATAGVPSGFSASLSYTTADAILNLVATLGKGDGLNGNQQNVANAINSFFNGGGSLPQNFLSIYNLTGSDLRNALSLLSGESATVAQRGAFQMTGQFLGLMLDPFVDGRNPAGEVGQRFGFAPEEGLSLDAYAFVSPNEKAAKAFNRALGVQPFERRWNVWAAGFGGASNTAGDAARGTHDTLAGTYGVASGLDYRVSPDSVMGFAVAGGGTNWRLDSGLGGGRSDALNLGLYGATRSGPAYAAASFSFANHWISTDRNTLGGSQLTGKVNGQGFGGRIESGYRYGAPLSGITPYAAVQAQVFDTPAYSETDVDGSGFALRYNSSRAHDVRTELGARFDAASPLGSKSILTLRGRLAWAHDWVSNPALTAAFQALPGSSFIVNGAVPAKDLALASVGVEVRLLHGVTLATKFDGEFGANTQTYAGTGTLSYRW
jgi:autotransporter-associated beta strand protein